MRVVGVLVVFVPFQLAAQTWNSETATDLVERAIERRERVSADSALRDYRARAHGFVFFLGQLGEGLAEPPRLIKSDELVLEVYWKAPGLSKQQIVGWRDRVDLPTDIRYHRDHLGIVQNNFGDRIRLGHGDEVRDVPHPLAGDGLRRYDYALVDSLTIRLPQREVRVYEVLTRPRDLDVPGVVGRLFIDVETAELVVFRFNFTRSAYIDNALEDITIVLESSLWQQRYWLPRRQEIEIRRRTRWLELPARGIIRGRWEIQEYTFNVGLADSLFLGPEIVAVPRAVRDTFSWEVPLDTRIREMAGPAMTVDLESVRDEISQMAGDHVLSGLPIARPGVGSVSEIVHFNRVEGLAIGAGAVVRPAGGPAELKGWASYGLSDNRFKARVSVHYPFGRWAVELAGARQIVDVGDEPVIAPVLNSILAQEAARDFGDYVLEEQLATTLRYGFGPRGSVSFTGGVEHTRSVDVVAVPARSTFRSNAPLGSGTYGVARLSVERRSAELALQGGASGLVTLEGGIGNDSEYLRIRGAGRVHAALGPTELVARAWVGWGSPELPAHRTFAIGGRGTLVSEPFREWGGRYAAYGSLEWRFTVPFPAVPLGPFASTGPHLVVAPFVMAGAAGGDVPTVPWRPSDGVRTVVGVGFEVFHRLIRVEVGVSLRGGRTAVVADLRRDLWEIL